jgi:hypothetical protein
MRLHRAVPFLACAALLSVHCGGDDDGPTDPSPTGSIEVTLAMTGEDLDADGCRFIVDTGTPRALLAGESATVSGLTPGSHVVQLTDLAANCQVQGGPFQTASVTAGQTTAVTFAVTCSSALGGIAVTTVTTGDQIDPDGYGVSVDGGTVRSVGANATLDVSGLTEGPHSVLLSGVAANCSVTGDNPRDVPVTARQTTAVTFAVACTATLGSVAVTTTTTGHDLDPNGYGLSVDGGGSQSIGTDATLTVSGLTSGTHSFALSGMAANCSVTGDNPRDVTVSAEQTTSTSFQVECLRRLSGKIVFVSDRAGALELFAVDPDGSNLEQITSLGLGLATPSVSPDGTRIAVTVSLGGNNEIAVVNSNGGDLTNVTHNGSNDTWPDWSPDGSRIAFGSDRAGFEAVWVMDADGSNPQNVSGASGFEPSWSPDGTKIAFTSSRDGNNEVYVMNVDGSGQVNLTSDPDADISPSWSPDGLWIAWVSRRAGMDDICIMGSDGSGFFNLTESPGALDAYPRWSPDSGRIAFFSNLHDESQFVYDVYTVETNGTNRIRLTSGPSSDAFPDWGPAP